MDRKEKSKKLESMIERMKEQRAKVEQLKAKLGEETKSSEKKVEEPIIEKQPEENKNKEEKNSENEPTPEQENVCELEKEKVESPKEENPIESKIDHTPQEEMQKEDKVEEPKESKVSVDSSSSNKKEEETPATPTSPKMNSSQQQQPQKEDTTVNDFISLFNSRSFSFMKNLTVIFGKKIRIRCHKAILAQSPFVYEEIRNLTKNESDVYVADDIKELSKAEVVFVTQFFYGKVPNASPKVRPEELLKLGRRFLVPELVRYIYEIYKTELGEIKKEDQRFFRNVNEKEQQKETTAISCCSNFVGGKLFAEIISGLEDSFTFEGLEGNDDVFFGGKCLNYYFLSREGTPIPCHREVLVTRFPFFREEIPDDKSPSFCRVHLYSSDILLLLFFIYNYNEEEKDNITKKRLTELLQEKLEPRELQSMKRHFQNENMSRSMFRLLRFCVMGNGSLLDRPHSKELKKSLISFLSTQLLEIKDELDEILVKEFTSTIQRIPALCEGFSIPPKEIPDEVNMMDLCSQLYLWVSEVAYLKDGLIVGLKDKIRIEEKKIEEIRATQMKLLKELEKHKEENEKLQKELARVHSQITIKKKKGESVEELEKSEEELKKNLKETEDALLRNFGEKGETDREVDKLQKKIHVLKKGLNWSQKLKLQNWK